MAAKKKTEKAAPQSISVRWKKTDINPGAPTKAVTHVLWTRVGADVQLEMCVADLTDVRELVIAPSSEEPPILDLKVYDRYLVTANALLELRKMLDEAFKAMTENAAALQSHLAEAKASQKH